MKQEEGTNKIQKESGKDPYLKKLLLKLWTVAFSLRADNQILWKGRGFELAFYQLMPKKWKALVGLP